MGWFDDQLQLREEKDDSSFQKAMDQIAGAVMGRRLAAALMDHREAAGNAIDEILKYCHCSIEKLRDVPEGETLEEQLEIRLRPLGIQRRNVRLENNWFRDSVGAMLGTTREGNIPVALLPHGYAGYIFHDPATGKAVRVNRKTKDLLNEDAVCFYQPLPLKPLTIRDLLLFMIRQLSVADIVSYVGMMGLMALLGLLSPMFVDWLFGDVLRSRDVSALLGLAAFMISYSLCRLFLSVYQSLVKNRVTIKQDIAVQAAVMGRVMSLPTTFFREYSSGELSQRTSYVQSLCSMLMNSLAETGLSSVFSLVYVGQIFSFAPSLVVPSLIIMLTTLVFSILSTLTGIKTARKRMLESSKTSGMTYSLITGIQKIRLAGAEKRMFSRWGYQYAREASLTYHPPLLLRLGSTFSLAISLMGTLVLYAIAIRNGMNSADYYAFNAAYGMMSTAFLSIADIAVTLANIRPTLEMARPILETQPEISEGKQIIRGLNGAIELSHVSFRYGDDRPWILEDLSLKIHPGEYVAITGPTGCGKSTLIRLLLGFETPQKGSIIYDRQDISRVDLKSLRGRIGTVMQDSRLFPGDIYSNIVISVPQLTLKEAWHAAELASVADDIRQMPMGMNTLVSEGQGGISGGQRQRLMIARALAPNPKVLIFDEATSALDNVTQKKVSDAIDSLHCTRIVIAHRLSTIRHCDRILVMDKGRIIEEGTYDQLIKKNGFFAELVERQRLA